MFYFCLYVHMGSPRYESILFQPGKSSKREIQHSVTVTLVLVLGSGFNGAAILQGHLFVVTPATKKAN